MKRRTALVILAIVAGISILIGCKPKQPNSVGRAATGDISGSLVVWIDNDDWARAAIDGFCALYPGVTVRFENVGNTDSRGKVSLDGPAGTGPDIFFMPHDHIGNAVLDDICYPIPAETRTRYAGFILDAAMATCTFDGQLYAVPITTENIAFFYNKDLLGNTPVPKSFEEVISFAQGYNNNATNKYALRWQVNDAYHNYFFLTAFGMKVFGPNMDDYKNPGFDSPGATQGITFHNGLRQYYDVNIADATWDATVAAFQRGEVPFTITGPWAIGDAVTNGINFGVTKIPTINGVQPRCFSGNIIAAVSSYSKNIPAALAFIDFITSVEGQTIMYNVRGQLPAYKDASRIPGLNNDAYLMGIMEQAPFADPMPVIPEVQMMWDGLAELFTFTWDKQLSVADAQKKAMETYDLQLQMAGKSR
jgi:arabinogalactan oligomer/maltooligosaccharide transport system substrate-binding protein